MEQNPQSPQSGAPVLDVGADMINLPVDHVWLGREQEDVLEPELPIVDPHHHLWDRPGSRYMPPDLRDDTLSGHKVIATVYVESNAMYRSSGPVELMPVGETEIMSAICTPWAGDGQPALCAAVIGYVDLFAGAGVQEVLEAHLRAGAGRFRGIRQVTAWHEVSSLQTPQHGPRRPLAAGMMSDARFLAGFSHLAPMGLSFDAWLYHTQLLELAVLARAYPNTTIVLNHLGGPIGAGPYRRRGDEVFAEWSSAMAELATCQNVRVKIGGFGMRLLGFDYRLRERPASSAELAEDWRPFVERCIELFGPDRCMFESNFPIDKAYFSYRTLWNAFKRLTSGASEGEKRQLFGRTATQVYDLRISTRQ
tara:strand:+ start:36003 stop:37097 length:1095 start_codon:yes stop_codon:yes gene_type:complete